MGEETARQIYPDDLDLVTKFCSPFFEARYKCLDRFIDTQRNVLELAVGTSVGRGISISDNPDKVYVGTDLPEMIAEAKTFFMQINSERRANHHLAAANVLSYDELSAAASHLGTRRGLIIVNEGLWMYLTTEEQTTAADNIRKLLEKYGGQWVTPDIWDLESNDEFVSSLGPQLRRAMSRLMTRASMLTGRDIKSNCFARRQEAIAFLNNSGFAVTQYPMVDELSSLTSIGKLWEAHESRLYVPGLRQQRVSVMSLL